MLGLIGWFIVGALVAGCLVAFWDDIRDWLNNTAADVVERVLGYNARKFMQRTVVAVDRVMNSIRNKSMIFTKKQMLSEYYDKVTITSEAPVREISNDILEEIEKKGKLVQEYNYRGE